ncbi:MAG TPA: hypothetical protein P5280_16790, partial [Cyclobacteriaceae bacterium]|nr:hypothetical protein [Cyclobacteriaceae bacterium]
PTDQRLPPIIEAWVKRTGAKRVVQFVENYGVWANMANAHTGGILSGGAVKLNDVEVPQDAITFGPLGHCLINWHNFFVITVMRYCFSQLPLFMWDQRTFLPC